jgi:hypothetical protein
LLDVRKYLCKHLQTMIKVEEELRGSDLDEENGKSQGGGTKRKVK